MEEPYLSLERHQPARSLLEAPVVFKLMATESLCETNAAMYGAWLNTAGLIRRLSFFEALDRKQEELPEAPVAAWKLETVRREGPR
jgi:hypothetical protein